MGEETSMLVYVVGQGIGAKGRGGERGIQGGWSAGGVVGWR